MSIEEKYDKLVYALRGIAMGKYDVEEAQNNPGVPIYELVGRQSIRTAINILNEVEDTRIVKLKMPDFTKRP